MKYLPANPKTKSTLVSPKSTVDLDLEPLICFKTSLQILLLPGPRHSFCPTTTRELKRADQKPTESGQNTNRPAVDLGYEAAPALSLGICQNGFKLGP